MGFLSEFEAFFTPEEQESELFKIQSMIGVNEEKAILEELNAEVRRNTELLAFPDDRLRSWLAALLRRVRNVVSARGYGKLALLPAPGASPVTIPGGSEISARNGKSYQLVGDLVLPPGGSARFRFIQGEVKAAEGDYDEIIAIPALGVDLEGLQVFLEGDPVPPVPEMPSTAGTAYDGLGYLSEYLIDQLRQAYGNNPGDPNLSVVCGALGLSPESEPSELGVPEAYWLEEGLQRAMKMSYIRPQNGYFAFYYSGTLFIKIYRGDSVGDPKGKRYVVLYRVSDGASGNMGPDQLDSFEGVPALDAVEYELSNDVVRNGVEAPTHVELVNLLREKFFVTTNVASVPEYTAWFLARPEIGDCQVLSDYERWRISGSAMVSLKYTGAVEVYLMGLDGKDLVRESLEEAGLIGGGDAEGAIVSGGDGNLRQSGGDEILSGPIKVLDEDLCRVRDIAIIQYKTYQVFQHCFTVQYSSALDDIAFRGFAASTLRDFYDLKFAKTMGFSLFQPLDLELVQKALGGRHSPVGLRVNPYHYQESAITVPNAVKVLQAYHGEIGGGWYEYWEDPGDIQPRRVFREFLHKDGSSSIYEFDEGAAGVSWSSQFIPGEAVGGRSAGGVISFKASAFPVEGVLRCFWAIKNQGMVPVGANEPLEFGARALPSESLFADKGIRFEKY